MGLGVLDDTKLSHVPGTVTLEDQDLPAAVAVVDDNDNNINSAAPNRPLKRAKNGIILIPQPSDDPRDPLNWPLRRRDLITSILCLLSVLASILSPLLAANTLTLVLYFGRTFTAIALLTGYHLLGVGVAGWLFVASARVWGKRHLYLLGTVMIVISSAWGGASGHHYRSLMAARFLQGVGLAPFEALVNASVGDLYCVHERGKRMALTNLSLLGGAFFTPVIVGKITATLGWQWTFYFLAIFSGAMLPLVILFVPETAYVRDARFDTDTAMDGDAGVVSRNGQAQVGDGASTTEKGPNVNYADTSAAFKFISKSNIMPFSGRKTDESFFKLLLRPFPLFFHPAILWACLIQGTLIGWTVLIGIVLAAVVLIPPLIFNEVETGYLYTGPFIGAILGSVLAGVLADSSARFMSKRNNGVYEPEFRIVLVIPQLIFGCAGLYGFGIVSDNTYRYGWFFALEVMAWSWALWLRLSTSWTRIGNWPWRLSLAC